FDTGYTTTGVGMDVTNFSTIVGSNYSGSARAAVIDSNNRAVVLGTLGNTSTGTYTTLIMRYDSTGKLDTAFGSGTGYVTWTVTGGALDGVNAIDVQSDDKIVVSGRVLYSGSKYNFLIARFTTTGALDTSTFGTSGIANIAVSPTPNYIW